MDNQLNKIKLSYKDIEKQIKKYKLRFPYIKNTKVEKYIKFPIFVDSFYELLFFSKKVPTQKEFIENYIKRHKEKECIKCLNNNEKKALRARLCRTYPSYIRDLHFSKMLEEKLDFGEVIYNSEIDVKDGVDTLIKYNNTKYAVCLYINTQRSQNFRKTKIKQQKNGYIYIELPLNMKESKEVGDFYLYTKDNLINLLNFILKFEQEAV